MIGADERRRRRRRRPRARPPSRDRARAARDARGRLPPPHRPDAGGLTVVAGRVAAVVGWHAQAYRRMWFGTMTVTFLNPIFFLLAMGVLLGTLVDRSEPRPRRAELPRVRRAGAPRDDGDADGGERDDLPGPRGAQVVAHVPRGRRDTRTRRRARHRRRRVGGRPRHPRRHARSPSSPRSPGRSCRRSRCSPRSRRCSAGLRSPAVIAALSAWMESDQYLAATYRFGLVPLFLFSGTFFPISQLPDWLEPLAWVTPLWHGVELCRDLATGDVAARRDRAPRRRISSPSSSSASPSRCAAARGSSSCEHVRHAVPRPAAPAARHASLLAPRRAQPRELPRLLARLRLGLLRAALLPPRPRRRRRARSSATSSSGARRCRTATSSPPRCSRRRR